MKALSHLPHKQRGAIAIVFGLTSIALFAIGGVVLDLGHLYIAKAELQNAADAAALAGAKDLNQTTSGINAAVTSAQTISQKNKYNFSTDVTLALTNIQFGPSPDGPWVSVAAAQASPQEKTFIKIDSGQKIINTYLMRVAGINTVNTSGAAVAGRFVNDITPLGVCAVDPAKKTSKYTYPAAPLGTGITEIVEFGFRRGVTYNLFGLNPLSGGPSDPYLLNPVDAPPAGCTASHSSANFTAPFMCTGGSAVLASGIGQVYTNTGLTASLAASLNSRFDDYSSPSVCDPVTAPPDTNIKQYPCKGNSDPACVNNSSNTVSVTPPINWMEPGGTGNIPSREYVSLDAFKKPNYNLPTTAATSVPTGSGRANFANYGVLWSYGPAYQADSSSPPETGVPITPQQANLNPMYSTAFASYFDTTASTNYPTTAGTGFPATTPASPYNQTSGPYFQAPSVAHPGTRNRRIINVVLVNCTVAPTGPASCGRMDAVGIGRFFMPVKADFTGGPSNRRLDVEFAGLIEPIPISEIKLYR